MDLVSATAEAAGDMATPGFTGGDKLDALLAGTVKALSGHNSVRVGFLEGSTYPDGTSLPMIAALQEFGGSTTIPAHVARVYRKIDRNGKFKKGGRFVKKRLANYSSVHNVPAHVIKIPSRPFFRTMLANVKPELPKMIAVLTKKDEYDVYLVMMTMGAFLQSRLQESIRTWTIPGNAPSTIRRKGFDKPLIDTGHMLNSVDFEVGDDNT